jgi:hypothetical protein
MEGKLLLPDDVLPDDELAEDVEDMLGISFVMGLEALDAAADETAPLDIDCGDCAGSG